MRSGTIISENMGPKYCKKNLLKQAGLAKEEGREEAAATILAIIKCKQD